MTTVSMVVSCFEVMFDIHVFLFFLGFVDFKGFSSFMICIDFWETIVSTTKQLVACKKQKGTPCKSRTGLSMSCCTIECCRML